MKKDHYKKARQILFYVAYTILIVHYIFKSITFVDNTINTIIYAFGILILMLLSLFNILENGIKKSLTIITITAALALLCLLTHDLLLPIIWLLIIAFGKTDFEKIVRYDLCIKTALVLLVVMLSLTGVLDIESTHFRGETTRLSLGFSNPNIFSSYVLSIIMELLYLRRKKYGILEIIASLILITIIFFTTGSRTQIFCIFAINILFITNKLKPKLLSNNIASWIGNNIFIIITITSLISLLLYLFIPEIRNAINTIMPDRIRLPANAVKATGIWLFGNLAYSSSSFDSALDNLPLYITIVYGIIPIMLTCIAIKKYMKNLDNDKTRAIYLIMMIYLFSCLTEKLCFRPQYNIFLLYAATFLYNANLKPWFNIKNRQSKKQLGATNEKKA